MARGRRGAEDGGGGGRRGRGRRGRRGFIRRWMRRIVLLGGVAGAVGAYRNKQVEQNRRRFDLP